MIRENWKYKLALPNGQQEDWTGAFETKAACDHWYEEHGKEMEAQGHKLILVKTWVGGQNKPKKKYAKRPETL
jgi:hypothetical protein